MFFAQGRLYFTLSNSSSLFYRYFTPENSLIGATRYTASAGVTGVSFSSVGGAFLNAGKLYLANRTNGSLTRVDFANGAPVSGTATTVSSPALDGADWRTRGLFLNAPTATAANQAPVADPVVSCSALNCTFNGTASTDAEGPIAASDWDFGDGSTWTGATASHTYAAAGTYQVKLTVTDLGGATNSVTKPVTVSLPDVPVSFVGKSSANLTSASPQVTLPAGVAARDGLLLFASVASPTVTLDDPAGWTPVRTVQSATGITTKLWQRVATAGEPSAVTVDLSAAAKVDLLLSAYRGTAPTGPVVTASEAVAETTSTPAHATPQLTTAVAAWTVSYWADNSSATTAWTAPAGETVRSTSFGTGGGRICSLATDSGVPVAAGPRGSLTATSNATTGKATMWTIALSD
jgi:PKD repeat protein